VHLSTYIVDAFSAEPFTGNPAAVVPLDAWLPDSLMQSIAAQNNLSETAFIGPAEDVEVNGGATADGASPDNADLGLRWFTPASEVDLCGHGTLAAAHVMFHHRMHPAITVRFLTRSGRLTVELGEDRHLTLDLPARPPQPAAAPAGLAEALGVEPVEVLGSRDLIVVLESPEQIRDLRPDLHRLAEVEAFAFAVTAAGDVPEHADAPADFVSRFFVPREGIPEDPVTGSAHCTLVPMWAERLGRTTMLARQLSRRGGRLDCELVGDRVRIGGHARTYLHGSIVVPTPDAIIAVEKDPQAARRRELAEQAAAARS
jgi:PhzF family phenazine biosynthesis protein